MKANNKSETSAPAFPDVDLSLFTGVDDVMVKESLPTLDAGTYTVRVEKMLAIKSESPKTRGVTFCITELTVLDAEAGALTPVGTMAKISYGSNKGDIFDKNIKALAAAVTGKNLSEVTGAEAGGLFSETNQAASKGKTLRITVTPAKAKDSGFTYFKHTIRAA